MGDSVKYYTFASKEDFDLWHDEIKSLLGYPLPSVDIDGNVIGEPFTTDYTSIYRVADDDWRAIIDEQYAEGLTESEAPTIQDDRWEDDQALA